MKKIDVLLQHGEPGGDVFSGSDVWTSVRVHREHSGSTISGDDGASIGEEA